MLLLLRLWIVDTIIAELWRAKRACGAPWVSKSTHPRKFGNHVTVHRSPARPSAPQVNQCLILTLSRQFGSTGRLILHTYCTSMWQSINVVINWQLSKQGIRWPVSPDHIAGSGVDPSRSSIFLKLSADKLLVFKWSHAQVQFFLIDMKYVVFYMCRTIKILISNWPRKLKFSQFLQVFQLLFDFSHQGHTLVALYVQFYALLGQNLTGEVMRKIYAASWNLFTLTAEADRVLCQLVMFFTVFFHWMYKMKSATKSLLLFMASLFFGFLVEKYVACQYWMSAICIAKLWNTAFCPRSVW